MTMNDEIAALVKLDEAEAMESPLGFYRDVSDRHDRIEMYMGVSLIIHGFDDLRNDPDVGLLVEWPDRHAELGPGRIFRVGKRSELVGSTPDNSRNHK